MPSASTMLDAYQDQLRKVRGWGNAGLPEECRLGKIWLALSDLVNDDMKAASK